MKIVFMGTPDFAVPSLEILADNGYDIVGVVTVADKPGGRVGVLESAVKKAALKRGIKILQPLKLKDPNFLEELAALKADLQVVVAFRMLPEVVWQMPPMGTLNLHGSLLPKYRGAAPINHAVMNGDSETGVTTFFLQHAIDTGDVIMQRSLPIGPDETATEVHDRMMAMGAEVVLETVDAIRDGVVRTQPQQDAAATHAPKIFHEDCKVDFDKEAIAVHNFIRGLCYHPGAWTLLPDGKQFKVFKARPLPADGSAMPPGVFFEQPKGVLKVSVRDGLLEILEAQLEGKKRMPIKDLLNGYTFVTV
jgi:methionyl-tRNA formyltransferase